jgi:hypothetical protein
MSVDDKNPDSGISIGPGRPKLSFEIMVVRQELPTAMSVLPRNASKHPTSPLPFRVRLRYSLATGAPHRVPSYCL